MTPHKHLQTRKPHIHVSDIVERRNEALRKPNHNFHPPRRPPPQIKWVSKSFLALPLPRLLHSPHATQTPHHPTQPHLSRPSTPLQRPPHHLPLPRRLRHLRMHTPPGPPTPPPPDPLAYSPSCPTTSTSSSGQNAARNKTSPYFIRAGSNSPTPNATTPPTTPPAPVTLYQGRFPNPSRFREWATTFAPSAGTSNKTPSAPNSSNAPNSGPSPPFNAASATTTKTANSSPPGPNKPLRPPPLARPHQHPPTRKKNSISLRTFRLQRARRPLGSPPTGPPPRPNPKTSNTPSAPAAAPKNQNPKNNTHPKTKGGKTKGSQVVSHSPTPPRRRELRTRPHHQSPPPLHR